MGAPRTLTTAVLRAGPSVTSLPVPRTRRPPPAGTGVRERAATTEERSRSLATEPPVRSGPRRTLATGGAGKLEVQTQPLPKPEQGRPRTVVLRAGHQRLLLQRTPGLGLLCHTILRG